MIPALEGLPSFISGVNLRNFYLVITMEPSDSPINSITIDIGSSVDGMVVDHVSIKPVPVPAAAWLVGSALAMVAATRLGRRF